MRSLFLRRAILAGWVLLFITALACAQAADKSVPNAVPSDSTARVKPGPLAQQVLDMETAHALAHYGRTTRSPMALITAASMLKHIRMLPSDQKPEHKAEPGANAQAEVKKPDRRPQDDPATLLAEARQMSGNDPAYTAMADKVEAEGAGPVMKGTVYGPYRMDDVVRPKTADIYRFKFTGGELATVYVSGDGDTDLDLYVYDENNNLVCSDVDYGDECLCMWVPRWTGTYTIQILNRGYLSNRYVAAVP